MKMSGTVDYIVPQAIGLGDQWGNAVFTGNIESDISATNLKDAIGTLRISHFSMMEEDQQPYYLDNLLLTSSFQEGRRVLSLVSDFAKADLQGDPADFAAAL